MIANIRAAARPRLSRTVMAGDGSVMIEREQRNRKAEGCNVTGDSKGRYCIETIPFAIYEAVSIARIKFFYRFWTRQMMGVSAGGGEVFVSFDGMTNYRRLQSGLKQKLLSKTS